MNLTNSVQVHREKLHRAIRDGDLEEVKRIVELPDGFNYTIAKNYYGELLKSIHCM